jgi:hypothetical protein
MEMSAYHETVDVDTTSDAFDVALLDWHLRRDWLARLAGR